MQYFKNSTNEVFAFENNVTIEKIEEIHGQGTLTSITESEADTLRNPTITIEQNKRQIRNSYLAFTDPMLSIPDYIINDILLTTQQKTDLTTWRAALKTMPTLNGWPNVDFPEPAQWIQDLATSEGHTLPPEWTD